MSSRAAIVGIAGTALTGDEAALFRAPPAGRRYPVRAQYRRPGRSCAGWWRRCAGAAGERGADGRPGRRPGRAPAPAALARASAGRRASARCSLATDAAGLRAAWLTGALIGLDCAAAGFDVVCAPVLDLGLPGAHGAIGDRAFAKTRWCRAARPGHGGRGCSPPACSRWASTRRGMGGRRRQPSGTARWWTPATCDADFLPFAAQCRSALDDDRAYHLCRLDPGVPATLSPASWPG